MSDEDAPPAFRGAPTSPWLVGGIALGWFVVLAVVLDDPGLAVALWVVTGGTAILLLSRRRRSAPLRTAGRRAPSVVSAPGEPIDLPFVLTEKETADLLRIGEGDFADAMDDRHFPGNRVGKHWRVRTETLLRWLDGAYAPSTAPDIVDPSRTD